MTRDEIIRMARELDMIDFRDNDSDPHVAQFIDFLVAMVARSAAAEREECAKLCDESTGAARANTCAERIRARGEKGQS